MAATYLENGKTSYCLILERFYNHHTKGYVSHMGAAGTVYFSLLNFLTES